MESFTVNLFAFVLITDHNLAWICEVMIVSVQFIETEKLTSVPKYHSGFDPKPHCTLSSKEKGE